MHIYKIVQILAQFDMVFGSLFCDLTWVVYKTIIKTMLMIVKQCIFNQT